MEYLKKVEEKACTFEKPLTITIGMGQKPFKVTNREQSLIEALRENPKLLESFEAMLNSSNASEGELPTADQVEEALIEDVRGIGRAAMSRWVTEAEERLAQELKHQNPRAKARKKKP